DVTLAFPSLLLLIAIAAAVKPSLPVVCIVIGLVGWAGMARLVRGQVLVVRTLDYVEAARALGASDARLVSRHILPNVRAPVIIAGTLGGGGAVVPRAGRAAAHPIVGRDGGGGTRPAARSPLGVALSRARDRRCRDGIEPAGRRTARRARRAGMTDIAYHPTRLRALRDTFRALRAAEFPWTADTVYLNNASIGPIPERTRRAL